MAKPNLRKERADLQAILDHYESGGITHIGEDAKGELTRDTTQERIASLNQRIAKLNERIGKLGDA